MFLYQTLNLELRNRLTSGASVHFNSVIFNKNARLTIKYFCLKDINYFCLNDLLRYTGAKWPDVLESILHDTRYVSQLPNKKEILKMFAVRTAAELGTIKLSLFTETFSSSVDEEHPKEVTIETRDPRDLKVPYLFCWLQALPLLTSRPYEFLRHIFPKTGDSPVLVTLEKLEGVAYDCVSERPIDSCLVRQIRLDPLNQVDKAFGMQTFGRDTLENIREYLESNIVNREASYLTKYLFFCTYLNDVEYMSSNSILAQNKYMWFGRHILPP